MPSWNMYLGSLAIAVAASLRFAQAGSDKDDDDYSRPYKHIAFFSVDGLHSSDLPKWVAMKPKGAIADLLESGYWYKGALTSAPSDSFPGTVNLVAGATPAMSGIWYDDAYGECEGAFFCWPKVADLQRRPHSLEPVLSDEDELSGTARLRGLATPPSEKFACCC